MLNLREAGICKARQMGIYIKTTDVHAIAIRPYKILYVWPPLKDF